MTPTATALIAAWTAEDAAVTARRAALVLVKPAPVAPAPAPEAAPAPAAQVTLRFLWNGLKVNGGKLQGAHYSWSSAHSYGGRTVPAHLTIYHNSHCGSFSSEVWQAFEGSIANDTDSQTDYFTNDRITVSVDHPMFRAVADAYIKQMEHRAKHADKMAARHRGRSNGDGYRRDVARMREVLAATEAA